MKLLIEFRSSFLLYEQFDDVRSREQRGNSKKRSWFDVKEQERERTNEKMLIIIIVNPFFPLVNFSD